MKILFLIVIVFSTTQGQSIEMDSLKGTIIFIAADGDEMEFPTLPMESDSTVVYMSGGGPFYPIGGIRHQLGDLIREFKRCCKEPTWKEFMKFMETRY